SRRDHFALVYCGAFVLTHEMSVEVFIVRPMDCRVKLLIETDHIKATSALKALRHELKLKRKRRPALLQFVLAILSLKYQGCKHYVTFFFTHCLCHRSSYHDLSFQVVGRFRLHIHQVRVLAVMREIIISYPDIPAVGPTFTPAVHQLERLPRVVITHDHQGMAAKQVGISYLWKPHVVIRLKRQEVLKNHHR